jgi:hypothetical protein
LTSWENEYIKRKESFRAVAPLFSCSEGQHLFFNRTRTGCFYMAAASRFLGCLGYWAPHCKRMNRMLVCSPLPGARPALPLSIACRELFFLSLCVLRGRRFCVLAGRSVVLPGGVNPREVCRFFDHAAGPRRRFRHWSAGRFHVPGRSSGRKEL